MTPETSEILKKIDLYAKKFNLLTRDEEQVNIIAFQDPKAELVTRLMQQFPTIIEKVKNLDLSFLNLSSELTCKDSKYKKFFSREEMDIIEDVESIAFKLLLNPNTTDYSVRAKKSLDKIILHNLRLVRTYSKNVDGGTLDNYDLFVEGLLGLIHAVDKYDRRKRNKSGLPLKFSTYATWWIRQYIQRAIQDKGRTIRIPIHVHDQINKLRKIYYELASLNFDAPPPDSRQLSEAAIDRHPDGGFDQKTVERLGSYLHDITSIDEWANEDENLTVEQYLPAEAFYQPENTIEDNINRQKLIALLEQLPEKDCKFMKLLYGYGPDRIERTTREIASAMGLKQKDVIKWEKTCLEQLQSIANPDDFNL